MTYIAGPPVFCERDYYRDDDRIIEELIRWQETKTIFVDIRRCGKTSLLKKVNYRFSEGSVFLDLKGNSKFIEKRLSFRKDDPNEVRAFVKVHLNAAMGAIYSSMRDNYFYHIFGSLTLNEQELLIRIALK